MKSRVDYVCALTNLYEHVPHEKVCEVYNQQNNKALKPTEFEVFLVELYEKLENQYVYVRDGEFIEETLYLFKAKFEQLCAKQEGKPLYVSVKDQEYTSAFARPRIASFSRFLMTL